MTDDTTDWNRLARYLAGECTDAEIAAVRGWLAEDPRRELELAVLERGWTRAGELAPRAEVEGQWGRLASALELPAAGGLAGVASGPGRASREVSRRFAVMPPARPAWRRAALAAGLAACLIGAAAATWWRTQGGRPAPETAPVVAQEFRTQRGERAAMTLLDGTRVALGPDSRMRVAIGETGPRLVELEGEAVFGVTHDSTRPFRVRTGLAVAEDLGTRFAVRAYAGEAVRVVVAEGIVALHDTAAAGVPRAVLEPRDLARVSGDGLVTVERGIDPGPYVSWAEGKLTFRRAPLSEVLPQIERWFDVRVVVEDSTLLSATVNAAFGDDSLDQVMGTLADLLGASVERQGRTAYLRSR